MHALCIRQVINNVNCVTHVSTHYAISRIRMKNNKLAEWRLVIRSWMWGLQWRGEWLWGVPGGNRDPQMQGNAREVFAGRFADGRETAIERRVYIEGRRHWRGEASTSIGNTAISVSHPPAPDPSRFNRRIAEQSEWKLLNKLNGID